MPLDPAVEVIRDAYGLRREDFWELPQKKGTWIIKHSALEVVAMKAKIELDPPMILEANGGEGVAAVCVRGYLDTKDYGRISKWSIGEASPKNSKNSYPWAMAEKRAVDRVILKLVGIHGLVYSEDEADDFKDRPATPAARPSEDDPEPMSNTAAKVHWKTIADELFKCTTIKQLKGCWERHYRIYEQLPEDLQKALREWKDELKDKLMAQAEASAPAVIPPNFDNLEPANG